MHDEREPFNPPLPVGLAALEKQLASIKLAPAGVDRDHLMFAAGQASVDRAAPRDWIRSRFWPAAATLATAASLLLATMLIRQRSEVAQVAPVPAINEQDVNAVVAPQLSERWSNRVASGYLGSRQLALTRGVAVLEYESPSLSGSELDDSSPPTTALELRKELLPTSKHPSS